MPSGRQKDAVKLDLNLHKKICLEIAVEKSLENFFHFRYNKRVR